MPELQPAITQETPDGWLAAHLMGFHGRVWSFVSKAAAVRGHDQLHASGRTADHAHEPKPEAT